MFDYAEGLNERITDEQVREWAKGTPEDWANEGLKVAVRSVYADVPADGPPPKLANEYVEKSGEVIDEQLARAGLRLATVLNRCLST